MDDYIKRSDAVEEIRGLDDTMFVCVSKDECNGMRSMKERAMSALERIPPADARPVVRGRWNVVSFRNVRTGVLKKCVCSVCSFTETYFKEPNFCPNCGADMRGEQHG